MPNRLEKAQELAEKIKANFERLGIDPAKTMLLSDFDETLKKRVVKNNKIESELIDEGIELLVALHLAGVKVAITTHTMAPELTIDRINEALKEYKLSEENIPIVTRKDLYDKTLKEEYGFDDGRRVEDVNVIKVRGKNETDLMAQIARKKLFGDEEYPKDVVVMGDDDNDCLFAVNIKKENVNVNVSVVLVNVVINELKETKKERQREKEQEKKDLEEKVQQEQGKKGKPHAYRRRLMKYASTLSKASKKPNESDMILESYERILDDRYEPYMERLKNHALTKGVSVNVCNDYTNEENGVVHVLTNTDFRKIREVSPPTSTERPSSKRLSKTLEEEHIM